MLSKSSTGISTEAVSACLICGEKERSTIYENLEDSLFGSPGKWSLKQCINCGLVFLDPRPTPEDIGKAYTNSYAGRKKNKNLHQLNFKAKIKSAIKTGFFANAYGYKNGVNFWKRILSLPLHLSPYWRERLAFSIMTLPHKSGGRLLDIGCGIGIFLEQMADLGWKAEGLDMDPKVVQVCIKKGLTVKEGTLKSQNYPDNYFDAITLKHVIEHVSDPIDLIRQCKRILKPEGKLVILTPNFEGSGQETFGRMWLGLDAPRHLFLFTPKTLSEVLLKGGLNVIKLSTTARNSEFSARTSYNQKKFNQNAYFVKARPYSRFMAKVFDKKVRLQLTVNKEAGDELVLMATK
jgi:2-polyprenyl-3-methyl-5-hydroxy-6-metoxy-1,4-benzoquinol methylase